MLLVENDKRSTCGFDNAVLSIVERMRFIVVNRHSFVTDRPIRQRSKPNYSFSSVLKGSNAWQECPKLPADKERPQVPGIQKKPCRGFAAELLEGDEVVRTR